MTILSAIYLIKTYNILILFISMAVMAVLERTISTTRMHMRMHAHERAIHRFETAITAINYVFYNKIKALSYGSFHFSYGSLKNETAIGIIFIIKLTAYIVFKTAIGFLLCNQVNFSWVYLFFCFSIHT